MVEDNEFEEIRRFLMVENNENGGLENYIRVKSTGAYYCTKTQEHIKRLDFNRVYKAPIKIPPALKSKSRGYKTSMRTLIEKYNLLSPYEDVIYDPTEEHTLIERDGKHYYNSYRFHSPTIEAGACDIDLHTITRHLRYLCNNNEKDYEILYNWMAYQVQNKGKLLRWSLFIAGKEQCGKSALTEILKIILGQEHVAVARPADLENRYNAYNANACVCVVDKVEEHMGHSLTVYKKIKPYITKEKIKIVEKNKTYFCDNKTNYLFISKNVDNIPFTLNDGLCYPIVTLDTSYMREGQYLSTLYTAIKRSSGLFYSDLLKHEIPFWFKDWEGAPYMQDKAQKFLTVESPSLDIEEHYTRCKDTLSNYECKYYNSTFLIRSKFLERVRSRFTLGVQEITKNEGTLILKKLGYYWREQPININGRNLRVWVKDPSISNGKIKERYYSFKGVQV